MTGKDLKILANWIAAGSALGGGSMLAAKLLHYLNESDPEKEKEEDDDTLYVYKKAEADDGQSDGTLGIALGIPGSVAAALGSAWLINKLYTDLRKKEAQRELDEAQRAVISASGMVPVDDMLKKSASGEGPLHVSNYAMGKGSVLALPLLIALTTGIVSNALLESQFPLEKKKPSAPRRIELIDNETAKKLVAQREKLASAVDDDAKELLVRMLHLSKCASSDIGNLVASIASQGATAFEKTASAAGFFGALDCAKGAAANADYSDLAAHMAVAYVTKNAAYSPAIALTAALDYAELYPATFNACQKLPLNTKLGLCKIASLLGAGIRRSISEELNLTADTEETLVKKATSLLLPSAVTVVYDKLQELKDMREAAKKENLSEEEKESIKTKITATSSEIQQMLSQIDENTLKKMLQPS